MARMSRPYVTIGSKSKYFPTYAEVKKNLVALIKECPDEILTLTRSRRGEWGEWFEKWGMYEGKPVKLKEGWM